jgi:hypothetical protein
MQQPVNKLEIISLNDASTSITGLKSIVATALLEVAIITEHALWHVAVFIRCDPQQVREVTLTTANGEYTFNMNGQ